MDPTTPANIKNEINVPQLSLPDHDLLIRLDTKMDGLANTFSQYYTDLTVRISKLENWKEQQDIYHAGIDMAHFKNNSEWVDSFRANQRLLWAVGGVATSLLGGVIAIFTSKWLHI